ncbi:MAG: C1 family peptidase [Bacteroidales bacterium]|nr:aminopeptidase [Rikenellaceae bacterium]MDD6976668.1 C1 family peptidase [Bacteroidales bacterium]MDY6170415.1 C1 family peptidase [Candidatus Cryptobacteroides sp.]
MKRSLFALAAIMLSLSAVAQEVKQDKPEFTVVKQAPVTSVKNQYRSGTCWCYSALSFVESEIIRQKGIEVDLSEMFVVNHAYFDRAVKYIRLDGKLGFSAGSSFGDVFEVIKSYGIVPQDVYSGMNYGTELPVQGELDAVLEGFVKALVTNPNRKLTPAWKPAFQGILDAYLGEIPATFKAEEKAFNPLTYRDYLGINTDDYINLTSFTHHPFYEPFIIEVCDNWRWGSAYNLPIEELMEVMYNAVENGYTIAWGADVSEKGFTRSGIATVPDFENKVTAGSDQERWVGKFDAGKEESAPAEEKVITQEMRQIAYDNKETTDDHGMHIYGLAKDQNGNPFFIVKNSWGKAGDYEGIWYASDAYVRYKTLNIVVHKDALPKSIKKKLGIK